MYLQGQSLKYEILDTWKGKKGKFVRTFGINTKRNENKWRATWDSIKEHLHTAVGMPGIAYEECDKNSCSLTHVEAETYEENVEKQKPFSKTNIIDYVFEDDIESADLIHEVFDDEFFIELQKGDKVKFVSPLIWPTNGGISINGTEKNKNGVELPVIDAYHWKFVHVAFLNEDPAFGDDVAQVKTTCEGENCQIQMLSAKSLGAKNDNPMCGNCKFFVKDEVCGLVKGKILYEDVCDLHIFGEARPKGTSVSPDFEKDRVNYRHALKADTTAANQENLSHLQETPLLYKHKGHLHLVAASQCVKDILHKKKEDGIKIDDQALAIAFSECGESNKAKSSFKTCTCKAKQNKMPDVEQLEKDLKAMEEDKKKLEAKLKGMEDKEEQHKSFESKKGKYAKLFAGTEDEDREKMVAKLKGMDDEDEHKAANEVHEEMKSKKANTDDPEKEEMKARLEAMEEEHKKPMVAQLLKARSTKITKEELKDYEKSLKGQSYDKIKEKYEDQKPLFADSIKDTIDNTTDFDFNGGENPLAGKTFSQIEEENA